MRACNIMTNLYNKQQKRDWIEFRSFSKYLDFVLLASIQPKSFFLLLISKIKKNAINQCFHDIFLILRDESNGVTPLNSRFFNYKGSEVQTPDKVNMSMQYWNYTSNLPKVTSYRNISKQNNHTTTNLHTQVINLHTNLSNCVIYDKLFPLFSNVFILQHVLNKMASLENFCERHT